MKQWRPRYRPEAKATTAGLGRRAEERRSRPPAPARSFVVGTEAIGMKRRKTNGGDVPTDLRPAPSRPRYYRRPKEDAFYQCSQGGIVAFTQECPWGTRLPTRNPVDWWEKELVRTDRRGVRPCVQITSRRARAQQDKLVRLWLDAARHVPCWLEENVDLHRQEKAYMGACPAATVRWGSSTMTATWPPSSK